MAKGSTLTAIADQVKIIQDAISKSPTALPKVARAALAKIEELAKRGGDPTSAEREAESAEPETKK